MKEMISELFKAITMLLSSVLGLATVFKNTTDATIEVSLVVKESATAFRMKEAIANAEELRSLQAEFDSLSTPSEPKQS